jgi:hypothetical protein
MAPDSLSYGVGFGQKHLTEIDETILENEGEPKVGIKDPRIDAPRVSVDNGIQGNVKCRRLVECGTCPRSLSWVKHARQLCVAAWV